MSYDGGDKWVFGHVGPKNVNDFIALIEQNNRG
jgi:hypothetical protein